MSAEYARQLNKKMGGVYRPPGASYDARYLDREERYEIARLSEAGLSIRRIAARLGRSPSTICRELRRNADPRTGRYQPERADRLAWERQRRPKPSKLSRNPVLREEVQGMLDERYSPEQASGRLKVKFPDDPSMRVSHETMYQSLYVYPRGGLRRELRACRPVGPARSAAPAAGPTAAGRSSAPSRSASARRKWRAAWSPATTRATSSWARPPPTPPSPPSSSG